MKHLTKFKVFEAKKAKGTPAKLYINDDSKTVETLNDFEFESNTLAGIKKELKQMSKELHKEYLSQREDKKEDNDWWYQGHFTLDGKKYQIEDSEISEEK